IDATELKTAKELSPPSGPIIKSPLSFFSRVDKVLMRGVASAAARNDNFVWDTCAKNSTTLHST
ncbi:hypothetical protein PJJ92_29915, partial [Mycobacterium kansasii]